MKSITRSSEISQKTLPITKQAEVIVLKIGEPSINVDPILLKKLKTDF